ncbi:MAG TPA: tetratricopeptide repeat protein [Stellaceae bacterium]|nr:tetratricopeptide repeat protein [Stellaceae bacterium]
MGHIPYLLIPLLQIICVVHVVRTGRSFLWIYVLLFLPGLGVAAYVIVEILPGLFGSRRARGLQSQAISHLDPGRELRHRRQALEEADTVDNRRLLAEALVAAGQHVEALELYRGILTGIHADDPGMLLGMARAAYGVKEYDLALRTVLQLGETNPRYQPVEAQLLHAMALEALGRDDEAASDYAALVIHASGEEVRCRYALLLKRHGDRNAAKALFDEILTRSRRAPRHYRRQQQEWIDVARREA